MEGEALLWRPPPPRPRTSPAFPQSDADSAENVGQAYDAAPGQGVLNADRLLLRPTFAACLACFAACEGLKLGHAVQANGLSFCFLNSCGAACCAVSGSSGDGPVSGALQLVEGSGDAESSQQGAGGDSSPRQRRWGSGQGGQRPWTSAHPAAKLNYHDDSHWEVDNVSWHRYQAHRPGFAIWGARHQHITCHTATVSSIARQHAMLRRQQYLAKVCGAIHRSRWRQSSQVMASSLAGALTASGPPNRCSAGVCFSASLANALIAEISNRSTPPQDRCNVQHPAR